MCGHFAELPDSMSQVWELHESVADQFAPDHRRCFSRAGMQKEWKREFNSTATVLVLLSANGTGGCLTGFEWNRPSVDVPPPERRACRND